MQCFLIRYNAKSPPKRAFTETVTSVFYTSCIAIWTMQATDAIQERERSNTNAKQIQRNIDNTQAQPVGCAG